MTSTSEWIQGPNSTSLYTDIYTPSGPDSNTKAVILFLHGFIEHVGRYTSVFPLWTEKGVAVVAFDQRGFGKTATDVERNKVSGGAYGKTSPEMQMEDIEFMINWTVNRFGKAAKLFLMGHSMGGCEALAFVTRPSPPPSKAAVLRISGIIATSPLVRQTTPAPKWQRSVGGLVSKLSPWSKVPAAIKPEQLSRDPSIGEVYMKDPLVIHHGTLRGVSGMLNLGDSLRDNDYKLWPKDLPVLIVHGTEDQLTSHDASSQFITNLQAKDKTFISYQGGYHELHNEPDGMREKLVDDCYAWVEKRLGDAAGTSDKATSRDLEDDVQQAKL